MKIYYNSEGWVCKRYPYDIPIDDENRFIEVEEDVAVNTMSTDQYYSWRVVDGELVNQPYVIKQWTDEERIAERTQLHTATDNDYAKYARQVRCNVDAEYSQTVLTYIDQYNLAVSDTANSPTYPQTVMYPEYILPSRV